MSGLSLITLCDKHQIKRFFFGGAVISWCIVIFLLSAENATQSSLTSGGVIRFFCELFVPDFLADSEAERIAMVNSLQFFVRKLAHFTAYLVLGFLSTQVTLAIPKLKTHRRMCACAWLFCVLYASSDEFHQNFVPGRAMQLRDVLIDSSGALLGVAVSFLISKAVFKRQQKRKLAEAADQQSDTGE